MRTKTGTLFITLSFITLSLLVLGSTDTLAAGNADAGKTLASKQCVSCHGADGKGATAPALKGLAADHITKQLQAFKTGTRKNMMMEMVAKKLNDKDVADVAAYYSALK